MADLLRPNKILDKLRLGEVVNCVKMNLADPRVAQIAALAGFSSIWLDAEHVPNSVHDLENCVRAAYAHGADTVVRVKRGSYSDLVHPLEMDAAGIMVPHVMSKQDALDIVRSTRFYPIGRRPLDGGNADGAFCLADLNDYMQHANTQKLLILQIEDVEALEVVDDIASVEGIDMLFFGPGDFSQSLGIPGQFDDPRIADARQRVAEAAINHGKFAGTVASPDTAPGMIDMGYRFLNVGADVIGLGEYFKRIAVAVNNASSIASPTGIYK